jgi:hypothetical protein
VSLASKHLIVLDIVETKAPETRRQWQLHVPNRPDLGDRVFTVTNRPPEQRWYDPTIQPENPVGRLFCQTMLPRQYNLVLHSDGKAEAYDSAGKSLGPVEGDRYHREYGQTVVQIDPSDTGKRTVFLQVLTAIDAVHSTPPDVKCREMERGKIELTVDGATTRLAVAE